MAILTSCATVLAFVLPITLHPLAIPCVPVVIGTLIGAVVVGVLRNGLTLMGVSSVYQVLITGILVILAVTALSGCATPILRVSGTLLQPVSSPPAAKGASASPAEKWRRFSGWVMLKTPSGVMNVTGVYKTPLQTPTG